MLKGFSFFGFSSFTATGAVSGGPTTLALIVDTPEEKLEDEMIGVRAGAGAIGGLEIPTASGVGFSLTSGDGFVVVL